MRTPNHGYNRSGVQHIYPKNKWENTIFLAGWKNHEGEVPMGGAHTTTEWWTMDAANFGMGPHTGIAKQAGQSRAGGIVWWSSLKHYSVIEVLLMFGTNSHRTETIGTSWRRNSLQDIGDDLGMTAKHCGGGCNQSTPQRAREWVSTRARTPYSTILSYPTVNIYIYMYHMRLYIYTYMIIYKYIYIYKYCYPFGSSVDPN